jgi:hypothetical protein
VSKHSLLQRKKSDSERNTIPQVVHDRLRSFGQPLDAGVRAFMEPHFGHDFGQVRIHTDGQAAQSTEAVSALAYTAGRDIVFSAGQYQPHSDAGKRLLAHEMAHVVQQASGPVSGVPMANRLAVSKPEDGFERAADHAVDRVMASTWIIDIGAHSSHKSSPSNAFATPELMTMQRCGATPCKCSPEEQMEHALGSMIQYNKDLAVQRLVSPKGDRHQFHQVHTYSPQIVQRQTEDGEIEQSDYISEQTTVGDADPFTEPLAGEEVRARCGPGGMSCPLVINCYGQPCAVADCGTGTCPTCPPGFGNLLVRNWCSYNCLGGGQAFIIRTIFGGQFGPICMD